MQNCDLEQVSTLRLLKTGERSAIPKMSNPPEIAKGTLNLNTLDFSNPFLFLFLPHFTIALTKTGTVISEPLYTRNYGKKKFTGSPIVALSVGASAPKLVNGLTISTAVIGTWKYSDLESAVLRALVMPLEPIHTTGSAALSTKACPFFLVSVLARGR